jgi:hypothetical protein
MAARYITVVMQNVDKNDVRETVNVKVKLSPCLAKYHAMKTYWGMEVYLHAFLTSALDGGEWSASPPGKEPLLHIG